jgi:chromosomal replication initiator protein
LSENLWDDVKKTLQQRHAGNEYVETWFQPTKLVGIDEQGTSGTCFNLGVPTELHKYWISEHFIKEIKESIQELFPAPFSVKIDVKQGSEVSAVKPASSSFQNAAPTAPPINRVSPGFSMPATQKPLHEPNIYHRGSGAGDHLNKDYTFSNFVVGRNNEFAHAACHNIAENPMGSDYNPLFICGPTGMGKTHLINAVANHILEKDPNKVITYVSAEKFLNDCVSCLRRAEMHKFRKKYRERSDVLLMDDIQILGRGEVIQQEFFHTLNEYLESGRQVVVASDRMPKDIKDFEDRIRTRLEWGLIADIQMPDVETRVAILNYKAEKMKLSLNAEIVNYIAKISRRSIREIEGNLKKIKMVSELQHVKVDLELCKRVLSHHDAKSTVTVDDILKLISEHYAIKLPDLKGKSRTKHILIGRQVGMYLLKKHLDKSLVEIGKIFGGKDHTTVLNAVRKIEKHRQENAEIRKDIEDLNRKIHNLTGV